MKNYLRRFVIIALLLLPHTKARSCVCLGHICGFLEQVHSMFTAYPPATFNWEEQIVIVKAAYIDSIPNSYGGSKVKLLAQYYGRPVKDTFNFLPPGTDCDLYLNSFHKYNMDTLFLILHRSPSIRFGDTIAYSMAMCGRHYAIVRNDSIIEYCGTNTITASAMADSLRQTIHTLDVSPLNVVNPIKAYPNPAGAYLTLEGARGTIGIVTNYIGQRVMQFNVDADRQVVNISALPPGVYSLQVNYTTGEKRMIRIVKQ